MERRFALAACFLYGVAAGPALAQTRVHSDERGYTLKSPTSTYSYRFDSGATYYRAGSIANYSARNGTTGLSYYAPTYRYDSFSNPRLAWSGSGVTSYRPAFTTYTRTYSVPTYRYSSAPTRRYYNR